MNDQGFLEGTLRCKKCDEPLKGEGSGYPAETYAGTYTGLCYPCTGAGPFQVDRWPEWAKEPSDMSEYAHGTELWSFPPACPSYRRDRRTFFYHPSCGRSNCHRGAVSGIDGLGGSYRKQCGLCLKIALGPQGSNWSKPDPCPIVIIDGKRIDVPMRKDGTAPLKGKIESIIRRALKAGMTVEWNDPPTRKLWEPLK